MEASEAKTFGDYVRRQREARGVTLRALAAELGIAPAYLSDIEKGNRPAPSRHLEKLLAALVVPETERARFFDLAGETRGGVSPDLDQYISTNEMARMALRVARDNKLGDERWRDFIEQIRREAAEGRDGKS